MTMMMMTRKMTMMIKKMMTITMMMKTMMVAMTMMYPVSVSGSYLKVTRAVRKSPYWLKSEVFRSLHHIQCIVTRVLAALPGDC